MKKLLLVILISLISILGSFAQNVPQKFNYQGVARLANGDLIVNTTILVRFSLIPFASTEAADYVETHSVQTNALGLFNVQIGGGSVLTGTTIGALDWDASRYIKIELDADGSANGISYTDLGTLPLLSVPYAKSADVAYDLKYPYSKDLANVSSTNPSFKITDEQSAFVPHQVSAVEINALSDRPALSLYSYDSYGIDVVSENYVGGRISNTSIVGYPSLLVNKMPTNTAINSDIVQVDGNSGGNYSQLLLIERDADFSRLSFASSPPITGATDLWTLAGKTDSQTPANARFHVYKSGTGNVLSVTGTGNVGIGNSDPSAKLEVAGQVKITGGSPGNGKVLTSDANGLASWQTISGTGFVLPFDQTYNNSNTTAFIVRNNDGNAISGISLDGTGVLGQSSTNYGVDGFSSSNVGISGRSQTGTGGRFISQSGPALVTAGGNVGLGTSSPTAQLEVAGQVKITGGSPGNGKVLTSDANGLATWQTPTGSGGLTLPYLGTYQSGFGNVVFEVRNISPASGPIVIKGTNISYSGVSSGGGTGVSGYDDSNNTGQGVSGFSTLGIGGFFSTNSGKALVAQGPVAIIDGTQGLGKVLTSDANGLATWQTPSGGGGGGQWSNTTGGIYNTDLTNVGIGTSLPYAKLHVEGGQVFFTGNINDVLRVTGTGTDLSAVGIQALNGTGLNTNAKIGIDAQGSVTGVKAVTIATSGGAGLTAESYSGTGAAVEAYNSVYSGPALKIINGGVVDVGGKWSYRATVNSGDPTVIWLYYPNPQSSDMIYLQPVGTGNGALNHLLEWDSVNSNWKILPASGTFDVSVSFNVMIIHAN
ncbi:MAG: hypothetical protein POELPBGB_01840 [Bacteroidia bacterium]|nr:hypothetical protein [Bacteroidia bacterium]